MGSSLEAPEVSTPECHNWKADVQFNQPTNLYKLWSCVKSEMIPEFTRKDKKNQDK